MLICSHSNYEFIVRCEGCRRLKSFASSLHVLYLIQSVVIQCNVCLRLMPHADARISICTSTIYTAHTRAFTHRIAGKFMTTIKIFSRLFARLLSGTFSHLAVLQVVEFIVFVVKDIAVRLVVWAAEVVRWWDGGDGDRLNLADKIARLHITHNRLKSNLGIDAWSCFIANIIFTF